MISPKVYTLGHHQNKENAFSEALRVRGWHECHYIHSKNVRFGLFDADWRPHDIKKLNGAPFFLYPHAARPMVQYDGCVEPHGGCRAMFVSSPAGVYLMEKIGYPSEVIEVGWSLCPIKQFFPRALAQNILFAPIHPNGNGWLSEVDKSLNLETYRRLVQFAEEHDAEITVRYCRNIYDNGLGDCLAEAHPRVIWKQAFPDGTYGDILKADVVVSHQTFAYMSVALGVPTVMIGEDVPPRSGNSDAGFCYVKHWEDYKDYMMFPLDLLNGKTEDVIETAISTDEPIREWRERFIGKPFKPDYFVDCIEERL